MGGFASLLKILSSAISIYLFICFLRILFQWIPSLVNTKFTYYLSRICDPYLNLFRGIRFLRYGAFDFSPVVAFAVLGLIQNLLKNFAIEQHLSLGIILSNIIMMVYSIVSGLFSLLFFILLIRLLFHILSKNTNNTFWTYFDNWITPIMGKITHIFFKDRVPSFTISIVIMLVTVVLAKVASFFLFNIVASVFHALPF